MSLGKETNLLKLPSWVKRNSNNYWISKYSSVSLFFYLNHFFSWYIFRARLFIFWCSQNSSNLISKLRFTTTVWNPLTPHVEAIFCAFSFWQQNAQHFSGKTHNSLSSHLQHGWSLFRVFLAETWSHSAGWKFPENDSYEWIS